MELLEEYTRIQKMYEAENHLIRVVAEGRSNEAVTMLSKIDPASLEKRSSAPSRNTKNYSIILNTLLRKAAEIGGVHPLYIDRLSSDFARKIENLSAWEDVSKLWQDMGKEYCELVQKHSHKQYSPQVQKVIALVEHDLTDSLGLKNIAQALNLSPGYLSTLFKKEMGVTLTDYVNGKRMDHAALLLCTTDFSASAIAQQCGVADNNYFTKLFKKHTGKTPLQYRDDYFGASSRGE